LITVKGKKIVEKADVIIYAGSLVNKEIIGCHKEGAEIYNSASMNLDEVIEVTVKAQKEGKSRPIEPTFQGILSTVHVN
ncbi:MAG: hypothetical protein ACFNM7_11215, partial [Prevotella conceptionensis]